MSTTEPIELITRIRYMMEYMALCADPTLFKLGSALQPYPVPSGIPMGIVTLPDFVVDVAMHKIRNSTANNRHQTEALDIGGRAGRLARVLQDFGGQQNGWYSVKYVAKAGRIGKVVLHRQLASAKHCNDFEPVSLRYIIESEQGHDWLHVYGRETEDPVESPHEGHEVTVSDIDESAYSVMDLFVDTRYVVIASKHAKHAIDAVSVVAEGLRRLSERFPTSLRDDPDQRIPFGVLVDLSALGDRDEANCVVESFGELKEQSSVFSMESTALCDQEPQFDTRYFDHVLVRDKTTLRLGIHTQELSCGNQVAREALTAGYVLASACSLGWKLLRSWHRDFSRMRPIDERPHKSFPQAEEGPPGRFQNRSNSLPALAIDAGEPIGAEDRIRFAALLAQFTESTPPSYRDLVGAVPKPSSRPLTTVEKQEVESATTPEDGFDERVVELSQKVGLGAHVVPRFENPDAKGTMSLYLPPSELEALASSCLLRDARRKVKGEKRAIDKAVMFDLDATLIDSGGMLRACWFNGLRRLFKEIDFPIGSGEIQTVIDVYETFVYKNHDRFRMILRDQPDIPPKWQPCDFRQVWNHSYAWATLLWILDLKSGPSQNGSWDDKGWQQMVQTHKQHRSKKPAIVCPCDVCHEMEPLLAANDSASEVDAEKGRNLTLILRNRLSEFRFAIQAARTSFWDVDYPCYPQARPCVQMLRATPGCEVYVVTEGHEETQLQKLKCAGLADLFPRGRVLSTDAASAAEEARSDLNRLLQSITRTREDLKKVEALVGQKGRADLDPLLVARDEALASTTFLRDLLSDLDSKAHKRFYSAVIDAIRLTPESPAQVLQSFIERRRQAIHAEFGGSRPIKFFMIGDRYDNDCEPLLDLNLVNGHAAGVGTCRILSGKRSLEFCPPKSRPPTLYVCDTLAQVGHIVHDPTVWEHVATLREVTPPVLLDVRDKVVLYGASKRQGQDGKGGEMLKRLADKFKELAWASSDETLRKEQAVQGLLDQVERDLAVCDNASLSQFFSDVRNLIEEWWQEASINKSIVLPQEQEPATILLKGALRVLAGVSWWRSLLRRPLLGPAQVASETLEWTLGSYLLRCIGKRSLVTIRGELKRATDMAPKSIRPKDVLRAFPFSQEALAIVMALEKDHRGLDHHGLDLDSLHEWHNKARNLPTAQ